MSVIGGPTVQPFYVQDLPKLVSPINMNRTNFTVQESTDPIQIYTDGSRMGHKAGYGNEIMERKEGIDSIVHSGNGFLGNPPQYSKEKSMP